MVWREYEVDTYLTFAHCIPKLKDEEKLNIDTYIECLKKSFKYVRSYRSEKSLKRLIEKTIKCDIRMNYSDDDELAERYYCEIFPFIYIPDKLFIYIEEHSPYKFYHVIIKED